MPKTESDWKRHMIQLTKASGWYARRFEDKFYVGFPDLMFGPAGSLPWVFAEAKMVTSRQYFEPSPRQLVELKRLDRPDFSVALVVGIEEMPRSDMYPHGVVFHFSAPMERCNLSDPKMHHSVDFLTGVINYVHRRLKNVQ